MTETLKINKKKDTDSLLPDILTSPCLYSIGNLIMGNDLTPANNNKSLKLDKFQKEV